MSGAAPKFVNVDTDFAKNSLKAMCIRKAGKLVNTHHLNSLVTSQGVIPYHVARHFLHKIESGQRLALIEQNSPHILGDDEEIWEKIIRKKFPDHVDKNYIPEDEEGVDWAGVFMRYEEDKEQELEAAKKALRQSYGAAMGQRRENTSHKVEAKYMPKPPKDPKLLANAGIPLSRRNYDGSHKRSALVGFIGQAATGIKRQRNLVELARKEAAAQVAMRKQAKRFMPDSTAQIRNAPKSLVQAHETDDRQKRLAPPPMPDADKPTPMDPVEARIARIKAAEAERKAKTRGMQMKKEEEEGSRDVADLFDEKMLAPSERKTDTGPQLVQLPGGGMARKLPVKRSPTLNPTAPRPPPKKVDIFFTGKKKPVRMVSPPTKPTPGNTSTGAIPNLNLNGPKNTFTPAKLPPRMTSMAQGDRGALRPTGTIKNRKAVEMKSMRPVTAVADRQGAGRPSAKPQPQWPTPTSQRPSSTPQPRPTAPQQGRSGAGGVASMLAGLVAKQDAERGSNPPPQGRRQPPQPEKASPALKRPAPADSAAPPAKRRSPEPSTSRPSHTSHPERSSSSTNRPRPTESPAPSRNSPSTGTRAPQPQNGRKSSPFKRAADMESPVPPAKRLHIENNRPSTNTPPSSQPRPETKDRPPPKQKSPPRQKGDPFGLPKPKPKRPMEVKKAEANEFQVPNSCHGSMPEEVREVMAKESGKDYQGRERVYERKKMSRED